PTLIELWCEYSGLTELPSLPDSLLELSCYNNSLVGLPSLPNGLKNLNCWTNQLTSLPTLPDSLLSLQCHINELTSLPPLPAGLIYLLCWNNQLASLPPLPQQLVVFEVHGNPLLTCLPPMAQYLGQPFQFRIENTGINCLPNIIQHSGSIPAIDTLPLCNVLDGCPVAWNIQGNVYGDDNGNCTYDNVDPLLRNVKVKLMQAGSIVEQVFSTWSGNYSFDTGLGDYTVAIDTARVPFTVSCPADNAVAVSVTVGDSLSLNNDFGLECKPWLDFNLQAVVRDSGQFFPNNGAVVVVRAGDVGAFYGTNCTEPGTAGAVVATFSGPVSAVAVSGNGAVTGNTITWQVNDFSVVDLDSAFRVTFITDTSAQMGENVCVKALVALDSGTDANSANDTLDMCFEVVNSYDPNVKDVFPRTWYQPNGWHVYTIHFQNTGTAPAQNIVVEDTLDQNFDWSSFQLVAYSHENLTQVKGNDIVHFNFPNIQLPDSTSNEPNSHGWIQYRIKTNSDIQPGTTLHNTAAIYFDFNDPIITNDALVTYCLSVEMQQSFNLCPGDSIHVGSNVYHQPGTYTNLLTATTGCDSIVNTSIAVQTADNVVTQNGAALQATANAASYQWIDCSSHQPVSGATNQTFTPSQNGNYAAVLSFGNGCTDTTNCHTVFSTALPTSTKTRLQFFPTRQSVSFQFSVRAV
ncbi:MAG TPA: hypothetical protein VEY71_09265, partial [Chitinophagales bacterium]|nr:hypothetical protein [Chitinophagales bacterium]